MKVAVLLGGISREREISLRSGKRIAQALRKMGHDVDEIDVREEFVYNVKILKQYDAVFNILHGTFGEDGRMQAILDVVGIPYTGSGVETSVLAFDKYLCNLFVERLSKDVLTVPKFLLVQEGKFDEDVISYITNSIGLPCVVKPRNEGSSIGTHICFTTEEFEKALREELPNYGEVIVQEYIKGREITVSIVDINGTPTVLPILELRPKKLFYDYEAKYTDGMTEFILPAELDEFLSEKIKEITLDIYKSIGCKHFARVDGIVRDGKFYFLEVNTLPGMTELSDLPMSAKAYGINFEELVDLIIKEAHRNPSFGINKRGAKR